MTETAGTDDKGVMDDANSDSALLDHADARSTIVSCSPPERNAIASRPRRYTPPLRSVGNQVADRLSVTRAWLMTTRSG